MFRRNVFDHLRVHSAAKADQDRYEIEVCGGLPVAKGPTTPEGHVLVYYYTDLERLFEQTEPDLYTYFKLEKSGGFNLGKVKKLWGVNEIGVVHVATNKIYSFSRENMSKGWVSYLTRPNGEGSSPVWINVVEYPSKSSNRTAEVIICEHEYQKAMADLRLVPSLARELRDSVWTTSGIPEVLSLSDRCYVAVRDSKQLAWLETTTGEGVDKAVEVTILCFQVVRGWILALTGKAAQDAVMSFLMSCVSVLGASIAWFGTALLAIIAAGLAAALWFFDTRVGSLVLENSDIIILLLGLSVLARAFLEFCSNVRDRVYELF